MPHLTQQITQGGPLLDILVGVSHPRRDALIRVGEPVPQYVQVRALIDTGASCTCLDPSVLSMLNVTPTGSMPVHTPSTGSLAHNANQYDVSIVLQHPKINFQLGTVPVIESELAIQGIQGLIGRDVLGNCLFVYDGQTGIFTLSF